MNYPASFWIKSLDLKPHPEGGWFREIYRSGESFHKQGLPKRYSSERNFSTSIYYMLQKTDKSYFHRIKSDEIWHYYSGDSAIEIVLIIDGKIHKKILGPDFERGQNFQAIIPQNTWFAAHLADISGYALIGCTVSPGFNFDDFELAKRVNLIETNPGLETEILQFTK